ncbi:MAG: phosphotransferase [Polyangiaceae bacterium]
MNAERQIAQHLLRSNGLDAGSIELEPIHGGRSGALTYVVRSAGQAWVLRVQPEERFALHFSQLAELQRLAATLGLAPQLIAVDRERRAALSEYITSVPLLGALQSPAGPKLLEQLGRQLAALHQLPQPSYLANRCPTERTVELLEELARSGPAFVRRAAELARELPPGHNEAVCHLDLNPTNILFDGEQLRFIDWETAGLSDPGFDLATLITLLLLDERATAALLRGYESVTRAPSAERLALARRTVCLGYGAEFLRLAGAPAPDWPVDDLPGIAEAYGEIAAGHLDMSTPAGQWRLGAAYLSGVLREDG